MPDPPYNKSHAGSDLQGHGMPRAGAGYSRPPIRSAVARRRPRRHRGRFHAWRQTCKMALDQPRNLLRARDLGIDTHSEPVVFLRKDSPVCRSEGLASHNRVLLSAGDRHVIATLYQVQDGILAAEEAGLSAAAWQRLGAPQGNMV